MENQSTSLKTRNIEVILIDVMVVVTTLFHDKLNFWQDFEASALPISVDELYKAPPSPAIWVYLIVAVLTILYSSARKSIPQNEFLQLFYGIGFIGIMLLLPGIVALAFNSLIIAVPALIVTYILLMKGDFLNFANKLYDHKSRIILIPVLTSLFISGSDYFMKTRIDFEYAFLTIGMLYLPIRLLQAFKEPFKFYHLLIIFATLFFFSKQTYSSLKNSPTVVGWADESGYLGDRVQIIKQMNDKALLVKVIKSDYSAIVAKRNKDLSWSIDTAATREFKESKKGVFRDWP